MSKFYTAQEMRERADDIDPSKNETESKTLLRALTDGRKVLGSKLVSDTYCLEQAADMLRQAAEIRERLDDSMDDPNGIAVKDYDYILHGEE